MKFKKSSSNTTSLLLVVIAAEVAFLTVRAIAERQTAAGKLIRHPEQPQTQSDPARNLFSEALRHVTGLLRRLFFGTEAEITQRAQGGRTRVNSLRRADWETKNSRHQKSGKFSASRHTEEEQDGEDEGTQLKGSMQSIAEKLKDPAWAGVLAANDGNISLTDAERAVPMPNSGKFLGRLDKNQFIGKGMRDHSP